MIIWSFLIHFLFFNCLNALKVIKIGAFFDKDDVYSLDIFEIAISRQNAFNSQFRLEPIIKQIESTDAEQAGRGVCEMVEAGAVAIVGPKSFHVADVVASICNELNVPHLVSYQRASDINANVYHQFTRNIAPDPTLLSDALVDVVEKFDWPKFAVIYDSDESLVRLNGILQMFQSGYKAVTIYKYPGKDMVKQMLKDIDKSIEHRVIIDCSNENIAEILKQGLNMGKQEYMSYFITQPDGHMLNIPKKVASNVTAIRLMTAEDVEAKNIAIQWQKNKKYLNAEQYRHAQQIVLPNRLKVEAALIRDYIKVLSNALQERKLYQRIEEPRSRCEFMDEDEGTPQYWKFGRELLQNIDHIEAIGITGPISFDPVYKKRGNLLMDLIELDRLEHIFKKVAEWNAYSHLTVTRSIEELHLQRTATFERKVFKVITKLALPYLEYVPNGTDLTGNDRFEGFVKDFMDAIASEKNFTYELIIEPTGHQGGQDPITGKWEGMIGAILDGHADLAICDFTITYERKKVIDYSIPFMTLGISILYGKPRKGRPELFNFLQPLDTSVWLHMSTAFLCVSIAMFFLSKITEADWENPHPCDEEPEELENIWNVHNSIWLTMGSIVQQGCDILPKGIPTRLTAAFWWFFAMIVTSSYTANMAAFLTKEHMEESFKDVEELSKESNLRYGLMKGGSTEAFFKNSNLELYQKMWATMEHHEPSVFTDSNEDGIARVKLGGYAFFMESASIEYTTQKECDLTKVGDLLDSKAYGIGMPMNSPFRDNINEAILKLKERRIVQELRERWWITNNYKVVNGKPEFCEKESDENKDTLDIDHVRGVFLILMIGIGLASLVGILEFMWNVRKVSISQKITPYEAFRSELEFACKVWISRKPVVEARDSESQSFGSSQKMDMLQSTS